MSKFKRIVLILVVATSSLLYLSFDDIQDFQFIKQIENYHAVFRELKLFYVDDIDYANLVATSIDDMLQKLDPYTVYYPESQIEDYRFMTTGEYGGIGATVHDIDGQIIVTDVYNDFAAQKAGIKVGDKIISIAGQTVTKENMVEVAQLLKGQLNQELEIVVLRPPDNKQFSYKLKREKVYLSSVPYYGMANDSVAYIVLTSFTENAAKYVKDAFVELKQKHQPKALILDLRNNPGGLLIEAVRIVNIFVEKGNLIVSTKGKLSDWNREMYATERAVDTDIPIAVLVNRSSASASEIVAGAIQDLDRGVVVGKRTYGKGLVQSTRDLKYNAKLKITTAKYYIPSGRCIQALDYSNRNEDGSVGHIPDSLISEFKTLKGRTVYDGGGVMPDVELENEDLSKIALTLLQKRYIFDYATLFAHQNNAVAEPERFELTEKMFAEFRQFLQNKDLIYKTDSEKALKHLASVSKTENYYQKIEADIKQLEAKLGHNTKRDLELFEHEIQELLEREIVGRYYYYEGKIRYDLKKDPWIKQTNQVLFNPEIMNLYKH